jgi:hypothetical protein
MKKLYFSLLSIVLGLGMKAQLTQGNHAPANNDMYSTWQCDSTGIAPGASGAGVVWNLLFLLTVVLPLVTLHKQLVTRVIQMLILQ